MIDLLYIFRLIYFSFFFFSFIFFTTFNCKYSMYSLFISEISRYRDTNIFERIKYSPIALFQDTWFTLRKHRIKINLWQLTHCLFAKNVKNKKKSWVFHTLIFKYGIQIENDKRKNSRIIYTKKIYICKAWLVMLIIYYKYICMKLI